MRDFSDAADRQAMDQVFEPESPGGGDRLRALAMRRRAVQRKANGAAKPEPTDEKTADPEAALEAAAAPGEEDEEEEEPTEVSQPDDPAEKEADAVADKIADGEETEAPQESSGESIHRAVDETAQPDAAEGELQTLLTVAQGLVPPWHDGEAARQIQAACDRATEVVVANPGNQRLVELRRQIYGLQAGVLAVCKRQLLEGMTALSDLDVTNPPEGELDRIEAVAARWLDHPTWGLGGTQPLALLPKLVHALGDKRIEIQERRRERDPNDPGFQRDLLDAQAREVRMKLVMFREMRSLASKAFSLLVREPNQSAKDSASEFGKFLDKWDEVRVDKTMAQIESVIDGSYDQEPEELAQLNNDLLQAGLEKFAKKNVQGEAMPEEGVTDYGNRRVAEDQDAREQLGWVAQQLMRIKVVDAVRIYLADKAQRKDMQGQLAVRRLNAGGNPP